MKFPGFPRNVQSTPVPDPLFNSLLEEIGDLAELKVTLRALWLLGRKRGAARTLAAAELFNDPTLQRGVASLGGDPQTNIQRGLEQALARGTLLSYQPDPEAAEGRLFLLNSEDGRRELARLSAGREPSGPERLRETFGEADTVEPPTDDQPNIFALYEDNIGTIGPVIADELKDAEESYPWPWIAEAFKIAIHENKRSWRYIAAILRRQAAEGRTEAILPGRNEEHHGEPGRHTQTDNRRKFPEDYQRR